MGKCQVLVSGKEAPVPVEKVELLSSYPYHIMHLAVAMLNLFTISSSHITAEEKNHTARLGAQEFQP